MTAKSEALSFNPNDLTVGDMEDFEEIVGVGIDRALSPTTVYNANGEPERDDKGKPIKAVQLSAKALKALVYIVKHAEDDTFTLADARKIKVSELNLTGSDENPDAEKNDSNA